MAFSVIRMITGVTVRTRIIVLAAIPLVGFLANGTAFTTGQAEVEDAFASVKRAAALAETSQDLKSALGSMRILVRDFAVQPDAKLVQSFDDTHRAAMNSLLRLEHDAHAGVRQEIDGLRQRITALQSQICPPDQRTDVARLFRRRRHSQAHAPDRDRDRTPHQ